MWANNYFSLEVPSKEPCTPSNLAHYHSRLMLFGVQKNFDGFLIQRINIYLEYYLFICDKVCLYLITTKKQL